MQAAQIRFLGAFFALGMLGQLASAGAVPEPNRKLTEYFECGIKPRPQGLCATGKEEGCWKAGVIAIGVREDGNVIWNGYAIDQKTFSEYLANEAMSDHQMVFAIEARFRAPYGRVASVVQKMQKSNINHIICRVPDEGD